MSSEEENPSKRLCLEIVSDEAAGVQTVIDPSLPQRTPAVAGTNAAAVIDGATAAVAMISGATAAVTVTSVAAAVVVVDAVHSSSDLTPPENICDDQNMTAAEEGQTREITVMGSVGRGRKRKLKCSKDEDDSEKGLDSYLEVEEKMQESVEDDREVISDADGTETEKGVEGCLEMEEEMKVSVEEDVGVTEFLSGSGGGFTATIKQRYSDFIVNEINSEGEVVHLTDLSFPSAVKAEQKVHLERDPIPSSDLLTDAIISQLERLQETKASSDDVLIPVGLDKELRGRMHEAIKARFPNLEGNTIDKNEEKFIQVRFRSCKDKRRQNVWKKNTGDYCKFVLYKENKDTLEAINLISKFLRVSPQCFSFAGTKDRRAKTSQELTAYRIEPLRLMNLNRCLRNIALGNFRLCKQPLKLGDLSGNRFVILLRNVLGSDEEIEHGLTSLRDVGFINYYGMQRFGTTRVPTHHVGRALLCGKWLEAVELILKPREGGEREEVCQARAVWWATRDAEQALKELKGFQCMERKLLEGLKKYSMNNLVSALSWIPSKMRLMYIHAYQSYIWNRVVSRRLREFGGHPVMGDLAFKDRIQADGLDEQRETQNKKAGKQEPIEVTKENLSEFSITDIVLPLPGFDVQYPKNEIKSWYEEILAEDEMANFNFRNRVRDYSLPGGYRKIVVQPDHVAWDILYYDDYQVSLVRGDLEMLKASEQPPPKLTEGRFKAVRLELSLPSSSYATMALREVLKCGTSAAYHTTLNVT